MEIAITAAVAAGIAAAVAWVARGYGRRQAGAATVGGTALLDTRPEQPRIAAPEAGADVKREVRDAHPAELAREDVKQELAQLREQVELELRERRAETARLEERVLQREESLEARLEE